MWKTPHKIGIKKYSERGEKKNHYSTKGCISFQEQWIKSQFISSDNDFIKFYVCFYVCSYLKSLLAVVPFAKSPALSPTLYKFSVLGSYPKSFGLRLQIVTLQEYFNTFHKEYFKNQHISLDLTEGVIEFGIRSFWKHRTRNWLV